MKKTLALLLVASLLLAGCTELISSDDDDEVKKIEINEEIAIEKINDLITVEEDESFGITMMYDMDPSMMGSEGMLEFDEDSDAMITIEMTEAWSPEGYHFSTVMGLTEDGATMKMTQSFTHIGTTIYTSIGYETIGDVCANEDTPEETEACEEDVENIPPTQFYSMEAANTHTQLIAAMAEETSDNSDDFDVMGFLEFLEGVENYGEFTALDETVDGLQVFDMSFDMDAMMSEEAPTPEEALEMCDADNSGGISWDEFIAEDCDDTDPSMTSTDEGLWLGFSSADTDGSEELTADELPAFITAVTDFYRGGDDYEEMSEEMEMPGMKVAFNSAGEIEYFEMQMDEMGDELVTMKMYILTEDRVASFFSDVDAGELVALPFEISDSMYGDSSDWDDGDWDDGDSVETIETYLTDNWASSEMDYADPEFRVYSGFDAIEYVEFTLTDSDETVVTTWTIEQSDFSMVDHENAMVYYVNLEGVSVEEECYTLYALWLTNDGGSGLDSRSDICFDRIVDDDTGDDHDDHDHGDHGDDEEVWTFHREFEECDTDGNMLIDYDELQACVELDLANDGSDLDADDIGLQEMFYFADDDEDENLSEDEFEYFEFVLSEWSDDDYHDHHDEEFTCDDGETIPMYLVNDGEEDCVGGEDEGYVWTYNYDNCAVSDDGLSSLDCWTNEMDVDGDGTPEDSDSYWNYECEQLADGTWECGTDHINYYDNCAYEGENYYECWLDEWDTDNDGSYDLGSDGYMDYECEQLADGRWACGHSEDMEAFQNYDNCDEEAGMYECWDDDWVDSDGNVAITDSYELADCSQLEDGTWDCLLMDEDGGSPTFICGNGEEIPFEYVNDGGADCADGADEQQYDSDGNEINWFDCMDGSQVWISQVNDGAEDCPDGEDEMPDMDNGDDHGDDHGDHDHGDEDMVCYNMNTHSVDHTIDNEADCEAAGYMWTEDQSDDHDHSDHGDDHDDHDHDSEDGSDEEIVWYITNELDFHFEGDMSDYWIEFATCEEETDYETGETTKNCWKYSQIPVSDAASEGGANGVMYHDADNSGTISEGDMIHVTDEMKMQYDVRLYSVSADAYSDENPMLTVPGFTGIVGMLALLGAAFIRRNE